MPGTPRTPKNLYVRGATKALQDIIENLSDESKEEIGLSNEIDVARVLVERSLKAFDLTHYGEKEFDDELKIKIRENLRESLTHVSNLIGQHAKIRALSEGQFSAEQVNQVVVQMTRILERYLMPDQKKVFDAVVAELEGLRVTQTKVVNITIGG